jgi:hypothetical protein
MRNLQLPSGGCLTLENDERLQGSPKSRITHIQVTSGLPDFGLNVDRLVLGFDAVLSCYNTSPKRW